MPANEARRQSSFCVGRALDAALDPQTVTGLGAGDFYFVGK